ncbi:hypothetical protein ETD86_13230 [Nonomuraea turkmeniaca]|uniref:Uncharacterized protein n=1 Tax=Nonomuraea turkmeniaca TaxID=103838 RepID=A0A5S4FNF6_9ACTN|nr:hypothetical protein [Nonomuraea turkmeniaca]TMR21984.1 hypothetical protein ETD86_13230 [Nonomuraea turkmeniaca]
MTAEPDQEALAVFCAALPQLRTLLRGPASGDRRALVARTVRAARLGEPIDRFLAQLGIDHPEAGSEMDEAWSPRSSLPTPLNSERRPVIGDYVCPKGTCTRVVHREVDTELPTCEIHEQALRFVGEN